jgi:A/G-specific adenine glycosylase
MTLPDQQGRKKNNAAPHKAGSQNDLSLSPETGRSSVKRSDESCGGNPSPERLRRSGSPLAGDGQKQACEDALLAWYDRHRRALPWRAGPNQRPDPYRVWLSEIMLQQTTVTTVAPYFARFVRRWPDVGSLAVAPLQEVLKEWAGLGYYARARNLHVCAKTVVGRYGGNFPSNEKELVGLPGIGSYTAAAIAAIAFDRCAVPVDGNVERVVARLFAVEEPLPAAKPAIRRLAQTLTPRGRAGDFAQALMDLGATICTPRKPACVSCPVNDGCAGRRRGDAEIFPVKPPKTTGKLRRGAAFFVLRADGMVLARSRPPKGLLGGMTEFPTTAWTADFDQAAALEHAPRFGLSPRLPPRKRGGDRARRNCAKDEEKFSWHRLSGVVTHVFTHFPLELTIYTAEIPADTHAPEGARWTPIADLDGEALPTVMRKVAAHALERLLKASRPSPRARLF